MTVWEYIRDAAVTWFVGFFPLFEIYVAVPTGIALGLGAASTVFWSVFGNYTPVLLIVYGYEWLMRIERVRRWLTSHRSERFERSINRYGPWFVLLITPWTGVWIMAFTAKLLGMNRRALLGYSFVSILAYAVLLAAGAAGLLNLTDSSFSFQQINIRPNQIIILIAIIYALTLGRGHVKRLSEFVRRVVAKWRGRPESADPAMARTKLSGRLSAGSADRTTGDGKAAGGKVAREERSYDWARAKRERRWFYKHAIVFVVAHVLFFAFDWATAAVPLAALIESWREGGMVGILPFHNPVFAQGSSGWTTVLIIHAIIAFSYTLFPRRIKRGV